MPHALPACRVGGPHAPHVVCDRPEPSLPCGRGPVKGIGEEQVGPRGSLCFGQHISPPRAVSSLRGAVFLCLCLYQMNMVASPGAWAGAALSWLQMALYPTPTLVWGSQARLPLAALWIQAKLFIGDRPALDPVVGSSAHGCLRWAWLQPKPSPVLTTPPLPAIYLFRDLIVKHLSPFPKRGPWIEWGSGVWGPFCLFWHLIRNHGRGRCLSAPCCLALTAGGRALCSAPAAASAEALLGQRSPRP